VAEVGWPHRPLAARVGSQVGARRADHAKEHTDWTLTRHACAWETLVRLGRLAGSEQVAARAAEEFQDKLAQLWGRASKYDSADHPEYIPPSERVISETPQLGSVTWPALPVRGRWQTPLAGLAGR